MYEKYDDDDTSPDMFPKVCSLFIGLYAYDYVQKLVFISNVTSLMQICHKTPSIILLLLYYCFEILHFVAG